MFNSISSWRPKHLCHGCTEGSRAAGPVAAAAVAAGRVAAVIRSATLLPALRSGSAGSWGRALCPMAAGRGFGVSRGTQGAERGGRSCRLGVKPDSQTLVEMMKKSSGWLKREKPTW